MRTSTYAAGALSLAAALAFAADAIDTESTRAISRRVALETQAELRNASSVLAAAGTGLLALPRGRAGADLWHA